MKTILTFAALALAASIHGATAQAPAKADGPHILIYVASSMHTQPSFATGHPEFSSHATCQAAAKGLIDAAAQEVSTTWGRGHFAKLIATCNPK